MLGQLIHRCPLKRLRWFMARMFNCEVPASVVRKKVIQLFSRRLGCIPNIEHPSTFNEKMQWLKLHYRNHLMTICADKYAVRKFVSDRGYGDLLNRIIFQGENFERVDFDDLPQKFVVKPTHISGGVLIVREKGECNWGAIKSQTVARVSRLYEHGLTQGEWHYFGVPPRFVIEEYLDDGTGGVVDYKVHCMNGNPRYIQVDLLRFSNHARLYFDPQWNLLPFTTTYPRYDGLVSKPDCLKGMLSAAQSLSGEFPYARVDFYVVQSSLYFGEITFFHDGGFARFDDPAWDLEWGNNLDFSYL